MKPTPHTPPAKAGHYCLWGVFAVNRWLPGNSADFDLQEELPLLGVSLMDSLLGTKLLLWIETGQSKRNPW